MMWLAWRQARGTCLLLAAFVVAAGGGLLWFHLVISADIAASGARQCLSHVMATDACAAKATAFMSRLGLMEWAPLGLALVPALAGLFIGAPMVAREMERGTFRLAWTQGRSRARWFAAHLSVTLLLIVVVAAPFQAALWVVWQPVLVARQVGYGLGPVLGSPAFDVVGLVPIAYTLFAVALGVSAGALLRRTIGAMLIVLVVFAAARVSVDVLRPDFFTPVTAQDVVLSYPPAKSIEGAWVIRQDSTGTRTIQCPPGSPSKPPVPGKNPACNELVGTVTYQPASRFWPFQLVESGIYAALAILLLAGSALVIRWRRP